MSRESSKFILLFPKFIAISKDFFVQLINLPSLDVMYYSFTHSHQWIQDINSCQDGNPPIVVGQPLVLAWGGIHVGVPLFGV